MKLAPIFLLFVSLNLLAGPLQEINSKQQFESFLSESPFNGVLLVASKDKVIFKKAFGVRNFTDNSPLLTTDKFQIGSVSKQFTAAALLKLQQENKLSIDDQITKHLPQYPGLKDITIRDVLNHTSGVANYTDQAAFWQDLEPKKVVSLDEILNFTAVLPLDFAARSKWKYSNSGYIIAGKIVEIVSGVSWHQYIKTHFLEPLQMHNSGYVDFFGAVSPVIGHGDSGSGIVPYPEMNLSWALSAGGLYADVDDLLKWTDVYDTAAILSPVSKTQMQTPFLSNYGLGIGIENYNGETMLIHGGRTPGFKTNLIYLKTSQLKIVKFDNTDGGKFDPAMLALSFFTKGFAKALKVKSYPMDKNQLPEYAGVYLGKTMNFKVFVENEKLYLQPNDGQPPYLLEANDRDSFRLLGIAGEEFIRDSSGHIIELKHYQNGAVSTFTRQ